MCGVCVCLSFYVYLFLGGLHQMHTLGIRLHYTQNTLCIVHYASESEMER